jgi:hypothetical protein
MPPVSSPGAGASIAKAKLLASALMAASRAQLDTNAFALLALLIAESWPMDDGWATSIARSTMAQRLSCSTRTIDRARDALTAAGLIDHRPGDARHASMFVICCSATGDTLAVSPVTPQQCHPCHPRSVTRDTLAVSPVSPSSVCAEELQQQQQQKPAPAPAIDFDEQTLEARVKFLSRRPDWLPDAKPWILRDVVQELARSSLEEPTVVQVLREARDSRHTLNNPAGWVVAQLRKHIQEQQ